MALPESTGEHIRVWVEGEEAKERKREELVGELSAAMRTHGRDPRPIREALGE